MRTILLVDMNAYFASVTQVLEPALQGKPLIIAGDSKQRHGIVLAASYEAKYDGAKTGMSLWEAKAYAPQAIIRSPNYPAYINFSQRILGILRDFSPLVEPFSIDEAFVELTGTENLWGSPLQTAVSIKKRIKEELGLLSSVGIGSSKVIAKMAAELKKPDGITIIADKDIPERLWPLAVHELFGVGSRMKNHLHNMGIRTIGDLAQAPVNLLTKRFGKIGTRLHDFANGRDPSPVDPHSLDYVKSIGHQLTLPKDYTNLEDIKVIFLELSEAVCRRARQNNYTGKTVFIYVRGQDYFDLLPAKSPSSISRSSSLTNPTSSPQIVFALAIKLFLQHWVPSKPVRLLGLSLGNLIQSKTKQLCLFDKETELYTAIDNIKDRFGETSLLRGSFLLEAGVFYASEK